MGSMRGIEEAIRAKFNIAAGPALHDRVLAQVRHARERSETTLAPPREPIVRRMIMRSPIAKLTVAAMLIGVIGLGIFELFGAGGTSGVAWAQVLEKAEQAPTVVFDMTAEITYSPGKTLVHSSKNYVAGDYGTRSDLFMDSKLVAIKYRLPGKKVAYQIRVDQKKYWRFDLSEEQATQGRDTDDPRTWLKGILSGEYTKLDRTTINGVAVEGIESHWAEMVGQDGVIRLWGDVETNLPVRIEVEVREMEGGQIRPQKFTMENFQWNTPLDASLFEPDIPADYTPGEDPRAGQTQQETKAQSASPQALTEHEQAALPKIKETVRLFLQASSDRNWDEMLKHAPGLEKLPAADRTAFDTHLGGLEIVEVGEPIKTGTSNIWQVPCRIKTGMRGTYGKEIRVRYDETLGRFIVCGGL